MQVFRSPDTHILLVVVFLVQFQAYELKCPGSADMYISRGEDGFLQCKKFYNCLPGNQIIPCNTNCGEEMCVPCPSGLVQKDLIHSETKGNLSCYKDQPDCRSRDLVPSRNTGIYSRSCPKIEHCKCNRNKCFFGRNPCICNRQWDKCQVNYTMDPISGDCKPCGPGEYTLVKGCRPCFKINPYLINELKPTSTARLDNPDPDSCGGGVGKCQYYSVCSRMASNASCVCPDESSCTSSPGVEVCGSDNHTYSNECLLRVTSCRSQKIIYVKQNGSCILKTPVTSSVPVTYVNVNKKSYQKKNDNNTPSSALLNNDSSSGSTVLIITACTVLVLICIVCIVGFVWRKKKRTTGGDVFFEDPQHQHNLENGFVLLNERRTTDENNEAPNSTVDSGISDCSPGIPLLTSQVSQESYASRGEATPIVETEPHDIHPLLPSNTIQTDAGTNECEVNSTSNNLDDFSMESCSLVNTIQTPSSSTSIQTYDHRISQLNSPVQVMELNIQPGGSYNTETMASSDVAQQVKIGIDQPCEHEEDTEEKRKESMDVETNIDIKRSKVDDSEKKL